jgi:hypothetical protein
MLRHMNTAFHCVRFEILTTASMKMAVFWVVALYSLVEVYRRFRGAALMVGAASTSQTSVNFYTAQQPRRQRSSCSCMTSHLTPPVSSKYYNIASVFKNRLYGSYDEPVSLLQQLLYLLPNHHFST